MPQELHVLRCYSCQAFQVHIVKKSTKWVCKLCGEKQSIQKVYSKGSGKECRLHVQELNQRRLENNQQQFTDVTPNYEKETLDNTVINNIKPNRWTEFVSSTASTDSDEEVDSSKYSNYTFDQPIKKSKNKTSRISNKSSITEENGEQLSGKSLAINERWSNIVNEKEEHKYDNLFPRPSQQKRKSKDVDKDLTKKMSKTEKFTTATSDEEKHNEYEATEKHKHTPLNKRNRKTMEDSSLIEENNKPLYTFAINQRWLNNTGEEKKNDSFTVSDERFKTHLLLDVDQLPHTTESINQFSETLNNKTFVNAKSSRWAELISNKDASSGDEIENDMLSTAIENPAYFKELIRNTDTHIQDYEYDIPHFLAISKIQDGIEGEELKQKKCTDLLSKYKNFPSSDNRLQTQLFDNDDDKDLDEIFTF